MRSPKYPELIENVHKFLETFGPQPTEEIARHVLKKEAKKRDQSWPRKFLHSAAKMGYIKHLRHSCIVKGEIIAGIDESFWGV